MTPSSFFHPPLNSIAKLPKYLPQDQNIIFCAAFALHNYIRRNKVPDPTFRIIDEDLNFIPLEVFPNAECNFMQEVQYMSTHKMTKVRNDITTSLMGARRPRQRRRVS